ncbi:uncharacterized protein LOC133997321 [Scomber scombrus]|uniref:uncharacterized protein LOC133997321 n=1 Tax=Scomber scombrus TaxID=13677 RepID=UPI002DDC07C6|nr:uncharacterized protein LOC133997321 [Scomber scombrus]
MVEFKWIKISLFLIVLLQFRAVTGQDSYIIVRDGDSVTLPCKNAIKGQDRCGSTTWIYSRLESSPAVELINLGNITNDAKTKSDRLSLTVTDCSLVIKNVTVEDAGQYTCRQYDRSGKNKQGQDTQVFLSVININGHQDADDTVTLTCSVLKYDYCQDTVEWLYEGITDKLVETKGFCKAEVTFKTSKVDKKLFKCKVTESNGETRLCNFTPRTACEKQGKSTEIETTTRVDNNNKNTSANNDDDDAVKLPVHADCSALIYIMLVMRVAELVLITVVTVLLFRARAGNQRPPDDHTVSYSVRSRTARRSGPAANQMDHGEDDDVNYENFGENSASV